MRSGGMMLRTRVVEGRDRMKGRNRDIGWKRGELEGGR